MKKAERYEVHLNGKVYTGTGIEICQQIYICRETFTGWITKRIKPKPGLAIYKFYKIYDVYTYNNEPLAKGLTFNEVKEKYGLSNSLTARLVTRGYLLKRNLRVLSVYEKTQAV